MKIARVFPSKTRATPIDNMAFINCPPPFYAEADQVHISVTFTWDLPQAEWLAEQWKHVAPVQIGGPALGKPSGEFVSGRYVKEGYTITSRGCHNKCWFCSVWKREPKLIELPICEGWNLLDDNILACSEQHIRAVFSMLKRQKESGHRIEFTGGLEAKILQPWHVDLLADLKPAQMFFAYDTPDDWEPLVEASKVLHEAGFTRQHLRCYVLIGYPEDTLSEAEARLTAVRDLLGICPMAMLWRDEKREIRDVPIDHVDDPIWRDFQREWTRPAIIYKQQRKE